MVGCGGGIVGRHTRLTHRWRLQADLLKVFSSHRDKGKSELDDVVKKAISTVENLPKEKHVRAIVLDACQQRSTRAFWERMIALPQFEQQPVMIFKALCILHILLHECPGNFAAMELWTLHRGWFLDIAAIAGKSLHKYSKVCGLLGQLLQCKLQFHNEHPTFESNLTDSKPVTNYLTKELEKLLERLMEMQQMNLMMEQLVFSMAKGMQPGCPAIDCIQFPLVMIVQESMELYEKIEEVLFVLHQVRGLGPTLEAQRRRFNDQHAKLRQLYRNVRSSPTLQVLIDAPLLDEHPPVFFQEGKPVGPSPGRAKLRRVKSTSEHAFAVEKSAGGDPLGDPRDAKIKELRGELSRALDETEDVKAQLAAQVAQTANQSAILSLVDPALLADLEAKAKAEGNARLGESLAAFATLTSKYAAELAKIHFGKQTGETDAQAMERAFLQSLETAEELNGHIQELERDRELSAATVNSLENVADDLNHELQSMQSEWTASRAVAAALGTQLHTASQALAARDTDVATLTEQRARDAALVVQLEGQLSQHVASAASVEATCAALAHELETANAEHIATAGAQALALSEALLTLAAKDAALAQANQALQQNTETVQQLQAQVSELNVKLVAEMKDAVVLRADAAVTTALRHGQSAAAAEAAAAAERLATVKIAAAEDQQRADAELARVQAALAAQSAATVAAQAAASDAAVMVERSQHALQILKAEADAAAAVLVQQLQHEKSQLEVATVTSSELRATHAGLIASLQRDARLAQLRAALEHGRAALAPALTATEDPSNNSSGGGGSDGSALLLTTSPAGLVKLTAAARTKFGQLLAALGDAFESPGTPSVAALLQPALFAEACAAAVISARVIAQQENVGRDDAQHVGRATVTAVAALLSQLTDAVDGAVLPSASAVHAMAAAASAALDTQVQMAVDLHALAAKSGDVLDVEMAAAAATVDEATAHLESLLQKAKLELSEKQLAVNGAILGSSMTLMQHIRALMLNAGAVQKEILAGETSKGGTASQFYQRHSRWVEGLVSAAKAVGAGAGSLVDTADGVVGGHGKFEALMACGQEIAASTAQLVSASRVKAPATSRAKRPLEESSKKVAEATKALIEAARNAGKSLQTVQTARDFLKLSWTQAKRLEMNTQVRILELESQLDAERLRLGHLRRGQYHGDGDGDIEGPVA